MRLKMRLDTKANSICLISGFQHAHIQYTPIGHVFKGSIATTIKSKCHDCLQSCPMLCFAAMTTLAGQPLWTKTFHYESRTSSHTVHHQLVHDLGKIRQWPHINLNHILHCFSLRVVHQKQFCWKCDHCLFFPHLNKNCYYCYFKPFLCFDSSNFVLATRKGCIYKHCNVKLGCNSLSNSMSTTVISGL